MFECLCTPRRRGSAWEALGPGGVRARLAGFRSVFRGSRLRMHAGGQVCFMIWWTEIRSRSACERETRTCAWLQTHVRVRVAAALGCVCAQNSTRLKAEGHVPQAGGKFSLTDHQVDGINTSATFQLKPRHTLRNYNQ